MVGLELLRGALDGLRSHRLRSGLTTLGVIFGVAAVVGMASIGEGARREALRQIEVMGASNILIDFARPEEGDERETALNRNPQGLTIRDCDALRELVPGAKVVVPMRTQERKILAGERKATLNLVATTPDLFELYNLRLIHGRKLTLSDETNFRRVCVLGCGARLELFPLESPLDREILVGRQLYTVVGVAARGPAGGIDIEGVDLRDRNMDIYVPLATSLKRDPPLGGDSPLTRIIVQMPEPERLDLFAGLVERIIHRRHREVRDFKVIVPVELLRQHQETQRIFNIVMGTIASISLLVGGIGIMNIMLASVLERTREIGIRRAVGARQSDIARQFLVEAVLLSLSGGVVGVLVGVLLARGITLYAGWETAVSLWAILVAVAVAVGVGIIFGWLPARRAARLDPITALRFE